MFWTKKKAKPRNEAELIEQSLKEIRDIQAKRAKTLPKFYRRLWPEWLDRRVVFGLIAVLVIVLADGVRRENQEFVAILTQSQGQVTCAKSVEAGAQPIALQARCEDGNIISTGPGSSATLEFPDGTAVTLGPSTVFEIRLLEYNRGGQWRTRSFRLLGGTLSAKVSHFFGAGSDMRIYTPASVAAVRGTQFNVAYDASSKQTSVSCAEGTVAYASWAGQPVAVTAGTEARNAYGEAPSAPTPAQVAPFSAAAMIPDKKTPFLKRIELTLTAWLDLPMSVLGIGRCSWGVGAAEIARRTAAQEALRLIHVNIESQAGGYPNFVDPCTLAELNIPAQYLKRITTPLYGAGIERYFKQGDSFVIYARARDKQRTLYKLSSYGVEKATPEEAQSLGL
jgi:hypothetical protein